MKYNKLIKYLIIYRLVDIIAGELTGNIVEYSHCLAHCCIQLL